MKKHLGEVIYHLAEEKGLSLYDLADQVPNTNASSFSKIRSGSYARLSDERLNDIANALAGDDLVKRNSIICAYLKDMCPRDYRHQIEISSKRKPKSVAALNTSGIGHILDVLGQAAAKDDAFLEHLGTLTNLANSIIERES